MYGLRRLCLDGRTGMQGYQTADGRYRVTRDPSDTPDQGWWITVAESGEAIHPAPFRLMRHAADYLAMEQAYLSILR